MATISPEEEDGSDVSPGSACDVSFDWSHDIVHVSVRDAVVVDGWSCDVESWTSAEACDESDTLCSYVVVTESLVCVCY